MNAPIAKTISEAETQLTRAVQRYESSKSACLAMYGSLSILVVPQPDFKVLAAASWEVERSRARLGDLRARRRAEMSRFARFGV